MDRREALRTLAGGLAAGVGATLAGCLGGEADGESLDRYTDVDGGTRTPPPTGTPGPVQSPTPVDPVATAESLGTVVLDWDRRETDDGRVAIDAVAENRGDEPEAAVVAATMSLPTDGGTDRTLRRTATLSLAPGERIEETFAFEVTMDELYSGGSLEFDVRPPA